MFPILYPLAALLGLSPEKPRSAPSGDHLQDLPEALRGDCERAREPHVCEDTVKVAMLEYDERRAKVLEGWPGIVNPYRIRRDEAEGVFRVERAEEALPATGKQARDRAERCWGAIAVYGRHCRDLVAEQREYVLKYAFWDPPVPFISWKPLGPAAGFLTHDSAYRWLLSFIDPTRGTAEYTADGSPADPPKAKPRKAK